MHEDPVSDPVDAFAARVREGRAPSQGDLRAVQHVLSMWLARRGLTPEDREEVIADAVHRLMTAAGTGRLDPTRPAGAWLRVVADHLALDVHRRARGPAVPFDEHIHGQRRQDDRIAALLDAAAADEDVSRALRDAADAGEYELVRVITTWLDLAEASGAAPATREVGERCGISHTSVQRALQTFARHLRH